MQTDRQASPAGSLARVLAALLLWLAWLGRADLRAAEEPPHPLVWDAVEKSLDVKPEDGAADFQFTVTNKAQRPIEIAAVSPSCGCTVAEMPRRPWILAPGEKGSFTATVDFRGKHGKFTKTIFVSSTPGVQVLQVTVNIPDSPDAERERNRQMAHMDRQAVFRGQCATCHAAPTIGKTGEELFRAACAICHLAAPRAEMVTDLTVAREKRDADYWRKWITEGKAGTLMPAFARRHQGPLSDEQITSLVEFALERLPTAPPSN